LTSPKVLVAGCGNVFLGDDGFGVEVVRRLTAIDLPAGVTVRDAGIRAVHLAYELLDGWDLVVLVDATARDGTPGTLYLIEPDDGDEAAVVDAHSMNPDAVLAVARSLGADVSRVVVVGCEPASVDEHMGLSPSVEAAVDEAVRMVSELVESAMGKV
jgi:hydrogenase maturation protease